MGDIVKLTVREAAALLGVSETKIYRWVDEGEIPFTTIHHRPLFHRTELLEWAMTLETPVALDLYDGDKGTPFTDALERGGGASFEKIDELANDLPVVAEDRDVLRLLLASRAREMFITRKSDRIAVPRARSPIICPNTPGSVNRRWAAHAVMLGDIAINIMFVIVAPTIRRHHELLARLSLALQDRAFREAAQQIGASSQLLAETRRIELALTQQRRKEPSR